MKENHKKSIELQCYSYKRVQIHQVLIHYLRNCTIKQKKCLKMCFNELKIASA